MQFLLNTIHHLKYIGHYLIWGLIFCVMIEGTIRRINMQDDYNDGLNRLYDEWSGEDIPWYDNDTNSLQSVRYKRESYDDQPMPTICEPNGTMIIYAPTATVSKFEWVERITNDPSNKVTAIRVCCTGYKRVTYNKKSSCNPACERCRNGRCVAPNVCECYDGFVKNDDGDCVFACPIQCLNGRCHWYTCKCNNGYKLHKSGQYCQPICNDYCYDDPLRNCTAPGHCGCIRGFEMIDGECEPKCEPDCGPGGECQAFDSISKCVCYPGYRLKEGTCQNDCFLACKNGVCQNGNRCICNPGYVYDSHTRNCIYPGQSYESGPRRLSGK
ncbi:fibrillin-1-like [Haematobia irritans]|uniref:fibrillin-1-like n=1 Tax=Haematobia irritans TaxID=7368 RepID=UPI003F4F5B30